MNRRRPLIFIAIMALIVSGLFAARWLIIPPASQPMAANGTVHEQSGNASLSHSDSGSFNQADPISVEAPVAGAQGQVPIQSSAQLPGEQADSAKLVMFTAAQQRPQQQLSDGFTGSDSCRECHQQEHRSWHASYHRTMTQEINRETAPACIQDQTVVVQGKTYQFTQTDGQFEVTFADPLAGGKVMRRPLVLMTGSHHMNVFWYQSEVHGTPGQLEIVYLNTEQRWIPRDSSFLRPQAQSDVIELGTWNRTCSRCHATHPQERFNASSEAWNTRVSEFGIACEACHGEGAGHIAKHRAAEAKQATALTADLLLATAKNAENSDKIVNPSKLSKQSSADVCGQCHSIFVPNYEVLDHDQYMESGTSFRPGELLAEDGFIQVVSASEDKRTSEAFKKWSSMEKLGNGFWSDGMPRIAGREYNGLIESTCFIKGEMTCLSCHTMHPDETQDLNQWRADQLKPGMDGDQACLQCHQDFEKRIAEHTHHSIQSEGSRCMNCHMPHTTFGLLKTIRSHQVSSPSIQSTQTSNRPDACSLCHLDQSFAWVSNYLNQWYDQPLPTASLETKAAAESEAKPQPIATSVLHLLSGDAAQRVVQVAAMGRLSAQTAAGTDWIEPYLLLGLNDPYDAVRLVAARSLKTLPQRLSPDIDPLASESDRMEAFNKTIMAFDERSRAIPKPSVLVDEQGRFDFKRIRGYLEMRNHQPVYLHE